MATNFTVVVSQRQHFGNQRGVFDDSEPGLPFAAAGKDFPFDCPHIDPSETAYLLFQSRDVTHQHNTLQINGADVGEGLPASPAPNTWNRNILTIESGYQLTATDNVMHVESRNSNGGPGGDIDDFIIDNVVIAYTTTDPSQALPTATGDLAAFLKGELRDSIPTVRASAGRNRYVRPTAPQLTAWRAVFHNLLAGAWVPAHDMAQMISSTYHVVEFTDTTGLIYYLLMEGVPGNIPLPKDHPERSVCITDPMDPFLRGWGTYVFVTQPQRSLSLSAPHPRADKYTELQAAEAFLALRARTLLIAGTDRDENTAESPCAQQVPDPRPFREADVAHTAECYVADTGRSSVFQIAFEEIYSSDTSAWHLQFHGNGGTAERCEKVDVFLSNGVEAAPATLQRLARNITNASKAAATDGCYLNVDAYDRTGDCSLRAMTNMQMRFASGQTHANICPQDSDPLGPSRFIHIEQSKVARLAPNETDHKVTATSGRNRNVVLDGISMTFP